MRHLELQPGILVSIEESAWQEKLLGLVSEGVCTAAGVDLGDCEVRSLVESWFGDRVLHRAFEEHYRKTLEVIFASELYHHVIGDQPE